MNPKVFFDIMIANAPKGRLVFELFNKECPKTAENFLQLCTGANGTVTLRKRDYFFGYKNTIFHRIIPGFMAQGGDFTSFNGTGGISIYGDKFKDENFLHKHTKRGLLSMANSGPNSNGSQFFITFAPCPWLDGKHVVFGQVTEGLELLKSIESAGTQSGRVLEEVKITDCGKL